MPRRKSHGYGHGHGAPSAGVFRFKVGLVSLERWSWTPATSTGSRDSFIGALTGRIAADRPSISGRVGYRFAQSQRCPTDTP